MGFVRRVRRERRNDLRLGLRLRPVSEDLRGADRSAHHRVAGDSVHHHHLHASVDRDHVDRRHRALRGFVAGDECLGIHSRTARLGRRSPALVLGGAEVVRRPRAHAQEGSRVELVRRS